MKIAIEKSLTEFALRQSQERSYMEWLLEEDVRLGVGSCGILIVAQWKPTRLVSMRMQFRSLASLSGLRIWRCCKLPHRLKMGLGSGISVAVAQACSCSSDSAASLGTSICCRCGCKRKINPSIKGLLGCGMA